MGLWGLIVAALLVIGSVPFFLGPTMVFPVLGTSFLTEGCVCIASYWNEAQCGMVVDNESGSHISFLLQCCTRAATVLHGFSVLPPTSRLPAKTFHRRGWTGPASRIMIVALGFSLGSGGHFSLSIERSHVR
jgi:hypothetical protein